MKELEIIDRIRRAFPGNGIGDDTAVLPAPRGDLLFASDAIVENVHFSRRFSTPSQAIQKLVTSNVSDVYAMGGAPLSIVLSAGFPPGCPDADVDGVIDGLALACRHYGVTVGGGDTVRSPGGAFFDVAIVGEAPAGKALRRAGARPGDAIVLVGEIGPSLAGLALLSALFDRSCSSSFPAPRIRDCAALGARLRTIVPGLSLETTAADLRARAAGIAHVPFAADILRFVRHHLAPAAAPLEPAFLESGAVTATIDVSDGVAKDLRMICVESGVGALVHEEALPVPRAIGELFELDGERLADFALGSGEEYVLLAAVKPEAAERLPRGAAVIGSFGPAAGGIMITGASGTRDLPPLGFEHSF